MVGRQGSFAAISLCVLQYRTGPCRYSGMSIEQQKILDLIAKASNDEKVEQLLNALIDEASFSDVAEIKAILNDRLAWEKTPQIKYNYWKALEFLD